MSDAPAPDLGPQYQQYRSDLPNNAALQSIMAEMKNQQPAKPEAEGASPAPPKAPAPAPAAAPAAPPAPPPSPSDQAVSAEVDRLQQPQSVKDRLTDAYGENLPQVLKDRATQTLQATGQALNTVGSTAYNVMADETKGVLQEGARSVYTGARNAVTNVYDKIDDFVNWGTKNLGLSNPGIPIPGMDHSKNLSDEVRQWVDKKTIADPKSVTGQLIQGTAQFLTGMFMTRGLIPGAGAGGAAGMAADAAHAGLAAGISFDPQQERLSNLVEKFPQLSNPVTRLLEAKPGDNEAIGMAKQAFEAAGLGPLTSGLLKAVRLLKDVGQAGGGEIPAKPPGIADDAFKILGDSTAEPGSPILQTRAPEAAPTQVAGEPVPLEAKFRSELTADHQGATLQYNALNDPKIADTQGGKILNVDMARELSPEYAADRTRSAEVHEPASEFIKKLYAEKLQEPPKPGETNSVLFTAGGSGAGKSTAIENVPKVQQLADQAQIVYDSNFTNADSASAKIEQALAANKAVSIAYVYRDPVESLVQGALPRAERMGRTVPVEELAKNHPGSFDTVQQLIEKYHDNPNVQFFPIDNSLGRGKAVESTMESIDGKRYTASEEELRHATETEYAEGRISRKTYEGTLGNPGGAGGDGQVLGGARAEPGAELERQRPGAGLPAVTPGESQALSHAIAGEGAPEQVPSSAAGRAMEPPQTFINFARIDAPTDVQRAMQEIANARAAPADQARAGVQSFEAVKASGSQQDAWNILKGRREGQPLASDQMYAARQLWLSSTSKLIETARQVQSAPTEENLFALKKMQEVHGWISDQVTGAATSAARSVSAMRIPVGPAAERLKDVAGRLNDLAGGGDNVRDIANRIVALADSSAPNAAQQLDEFAEKSRYARTSDAVIQFFRDSLLSSPTSQARILASNVSTAIWRLGERKLAEGVGQVMQTTNGVAPGEAAALYSGWIGNFKDAMTFAWKAAQSGNTGEGIGAPHEGYPSNISGDALQLTGASAKIADFVGHAASWGFGFGGRRAIVAQHDMALTLSYGAELQAQAVRLATSEMNAGDLAPQKYAERVAELLQGPDERIAGPARATAKYGAFLDDPGNDTIGKLTNAMLALRGEIPALNAIIPFVKIPSRIMSFTFERTPLAPLMSEFRSKVAAGGASRDLALAQLALGGMVTSTAADMVASGSLRGQGVPQKGLAQAQDREGQRRDSVKVGDTWFNVNGVHPIGKLMLLAADVAEAVQGGQHELKDDEDTTSLAVGTSLAIARTLTNASYMQGLANFFSTLHDARVGGAGESALLSTMGALIPQASASVARAMDPYTREIYSMRDEFMAKIPGLSKSLPPRRDLWGEPLSAGHDPLTRLASPMQFQKETHSPIDDEILKQGMNITPPGRNQAFGPPGQGVAIDMSKHPAQYSRLLELAGHAYKDPAWGLGAKELLSQIVSGDHPLSAVYNLKSDGPEGGKAQMVRGIINQYREGARAQLLEESPKLSQEVDDKRAQMQALKVPQ